MSGSLRIRVRNRVRAERDPYESLCVVMAVCTPPDPPSAIPQGENLNGGGVLDTLWLYFGDVDPEVYGQSSEAWERGEPEPWFRPMQPWQAEAVVGFWRYWRERVPEIVIHCDAGWSRSQGIAAALCALEGLRDEEQFSVCTPNLYVKSMVLRAAREAQAGSAKAGGGE